MLFTQDRLWPRGNLDDVIVVTEDIRGSIHRDSKHSEFKAERLNHLKASTCSNKLYTECRHLHCILFLAIPGNWCLIAKQHIPSLQSSSDKIPSMVGVNEGCNLDGLTQRLWHVRWYLFNSNPIEIRPILRFKVILSYIDA